MQTIGMGPKFLICMIGAHYYLEENGGIFHAFLMKKKQSSGIQYAASCGEFNMNHMGW